MSDLVVTVVENTPTVTVSDATVAVDIVESVTELTVSNVGMQGATGASGVVAVTSPITNSGTSTSAQLGLDQSAITLAQSQVTNLTTDLAAKANLAGGNSFTGNQIIAPGAGSVAGLTVNATTGTLGYPIETLDGTGQRRFYVTEFGTTVVGGNTNFGGRLNVQTSTAGTIGQIIRLASSPTADAFQVQNSAGTYITKILASGTIDTVSRFVTNGTTSARVDIGTLASGNVGLGIKGVASQSANLTEWQDSAGTVLARVGSTGAILSTVGGWFGQSAGFSSNNFGVTSTSATNVAAIIKGASSQTADLAQFQLSDGTVRSKIGPNGRMAFGSPATELNSAILSVSSIFTTNPAIVVRGVASQTADLQQWQDSTGTVLSSVDKNGSVSAPFFGSTTANRSYLQTNGDTGSLQVFAGAAALKALVVKGAASQSSALQEWQNSAGSVLASLDAFGGVNAVYGVFTTNSASTMPLKVKGAASQTASLQEWQASDGTVVGSIAATGAMNLSARLLITAQNSGSTALFLQAWNNAQTADLMLYRNSVASILGGRNANAQIFTGSTAPLTTAVGGATTAASGTGSTATLTTTSNHNLAVGDRITVAGVTPSGYNGTYIVTAAATNSVSYASTATGSQTVAGTVSVDAQASITARSAATTGLIVRATTSQSSDVLQVQNVGGGLLARVTPGGVLFGGEVRTSGSMNRLAEENSGGLMQMTRQTSIAGNPGANQAKIYLRDGTNAGTLKLVVRAGAAGAETTILDNIPQ
jgi:hypothetical protein